MWRRWEDAVLDVAVEIALEHVRVEPWTEESRAGLRLARPRGNRTALARFLIQLRRR